MGFHLRFSEDWLQTPQPAGARPTRNGELLININLELDAGTVCSGRAPGIASLQDIRIVPDMTWQQLLPLAFSCANRSSLQASKRSRKPALASRGSKEGQTSATTIKPSAAKPAIFTRLRALPQGKKPVSVIAIKEGSK
jgi:hypothetical protein